MWKNTYAKFDVQVKTTKEWFLVSEPVKGSVPQSISSVSRLKQCYCRAMRYVGTWNNMPPSHLCAQERFSGFELPEVGMQRALTSEDMEALC